MCYQHRDGLSRRRTAITAVVQRVRHPSQTAEQTSFASTAVAPSSFSSSGVRKSGRVGASPLRPTGRTTGGGRPGRRGHCSRFLLRPDWHDYGQTGRFLAETRTAGGSSRARLRVPSRAFDPTSAFAIGVVPAWTSASATIQHSDGPAAGLCFATIWIVRAIPAARSLRRSEHPYGRRFRHGRRQRCTGSATLSAGVLMSPAIGD